VIDVLGQKLGVQRFSMHRFIGANGRTGRDQQTRSAFRSPAVQTGPPNLAPLGG
jgi:hypothetical protein